MRSSFVWMADEHKKEAVDAIASTTFVSCTTSWTIFPRDGDQGPSSSQVKFRTDPVSNHELIRVEIPFWQAGTRKLVFQAGPWVTGARSIDLNRQPRQRGYWFSRPYRG